MFSAARFGREEPAFGQERSFSIGWLHRFGTPRAGEVSTIAPGSQRSLRADIVIVYVSSEAGSGTA
jgi:hypothetical protein